MPTRAGDEFEVRRDELAALARQLGQGLPDGLWLCPSPGVGTSLVELAIEGGAARRIMVSDAPRALASLHKIGLVALAYLLGQMPGADGLINFSWSELSRALGGEAPGGRLIELMRDALLRLATPRITCERLAFGTSGRPLGYPERAVAAFFSERYLAAGRGTASRSAVRPHPLLAPAFAAGAWSSASSTGLAAASSDVVRRLWLLATALTLSPGHGSGALEVSLPLAELAELAGIEDKRLDRRQRRLERGLAELGQHDHRFAGSYLDTERAWFVRQRAGGPERAAGFVRSGSSQPAEELAGQPGAWSSATT